VLAPAARLLVRGAALVVFVASAGCHDKRSNATEPSVQPAPLPPIDEPAGIGATLAIRDGGATWAHVRALAGDHIGLAPSSLGGAVALATGLPIGTSDLFSEHDPVVGALLEPGLLTPGRAVVAFHLRAADRVIALATRGQGAPFVARRDDATNADLLEPIDTVNGGAKKSPALGVFGNYLVVGSDEEALLELGPYATRNLAQEAPGTEAAVVRLRPGLLKLASPFLRARVASLGDGPTSLLGKLALGDLVERAATSNGGTISFDVGDESAAVRCVLDRADAASGTGTKGPVRGLLELPSTAHVGILAFEPSEKRHVEESDIDAAVSGYLEPPDRDAFKEAFGMLTGARGDGFTLGFENGLLGQAFYGRIAIADRDKAERALGSLVDLSAKKSVADAFAKHDMAVSAKETVVERVGDVVRVRVSATSDAKKDAPANAPGVVNLLGRMNGGALTLGSGADAVAALRLMLDGPSLASDPAAEALVGRLPTDACIGIIADPARMLHGATASKSWLAGSVLDEAQSTRATMVLDANAVRVILEVALR